MAKQLGIHQIKGKVGERSYYRTKGVELGVSRSINQGLSARVKNGEEYANTRLNNAEFKNANAIATAAFNSVSQRKRGMMRNFAVASMTKKALEDIKQGTGDWGSRLPATELDSLIVDLLENHAKGGAYDGAFGVITFASAFDQTGEAELNITLSEEKVSELKSLGIDGMMVLHTSCLAGELVVDGAARLYAGNKIFTNAPQDFPASGDQVISVMVDCGRPADVGMSQSGYTFATNDPKHGFYTVLTFLPYRKENGKMYSLQESCTYAAIALGQIPE